jgi:RNA polymerase sigma-70 factor (ECF subfamily)
MRDLPFTDLMCRLDDGDPDAARVVFDRYARRLVGLAAAHLPRALAPKLDPEDVVQSVFKSFFARHADSRFCLERWDSLWSLLTVLTVRKCGHRVKHFRAARRDVRREEDSPPAPSPIAETASPTPTPVEAILLAETLAELLRDLSHSQRAIVRLRLEGYTVEEISERAGCTERTAYRVLEKVRGRLADPPPEAGARRGPRSPGWER